MSGPTTIEWSERSWNPVTGCTKVSPGCDHCYAETFAERWRGIPGHPYEQGFDLRLWKERLGAPLRWRKPSLIFVNSMSDLFQVGVPDGFVMDVWRIMGQASHHTFQILTKRADRMERWMKRWADTAADTRADRDGGLPPMPTGPQAVRAAYSSGRAGLFADMLEGWGEPPAGAAYPPYDWMEGMRWWPRAMPHVWLGVSIESPTYYSRIRHLQRTPAAVRFLSCEPLLEPLPDLPLAGIGWVIVGGESGPGARSCAPGWITDIVSQCGRAGVPVFVKQLGAVWAREVGAHRLQVKGAAKGAVMSCWPDGLRIREMPGRAA